MKFMKEKTISIFLEKDKRKRQTIKKERKNERKKESMNEWNSWKKRTISIFLEKENRKT